MAVFLAHISDQDAVESSTQKLEEHFPEPSHYKLADDVWLIRTNHISKTVADTLGIGPPETEGCTGVVLRCPGFYGGYEKRSVWEWLSMDDCRP